MKNVEPEELAEEPLPQARVLFDFTPTSEFEIGVSGEWPGEGWQDSYTNHIAQRGLWFTSWRLMMGLDGSKSLTLGAPTV